ncbi:MAG: ParB N-terminal domain-containing protein [Candidatus Sericytochromatia bacterium]|nr:ParB N-terminal domain-containing protein [Candidatus Tanganyikabacteria bacterium]
METQLVAMDFRHVAPSALDLSLARLRQLPESAIQGKVESLKNKGQLSPLVAAEQDGALILVDGFVRHQAALRLDLDRVLVEVVRLTATQMKCQLYLRNRERGLSLLEECRLVLELCDRDGLCQTEIAELLERHKSWVCRRLALIRGLSSHLLAEKALDLLPGGALRRLAQLHARNQEAVMAAALRDGIPAEDVGALADLVRRAPAPMARRYVIDHPADALARARRRQDPAADPRLGEAGRQVLEGLQILRQTALRLQRRAREGLGALPPDAVRLLAEAADGADHDCRVAVDAVRQCLTIAPTGGST